VKLLDDRFANPAYGLLLVTGLLMVWIGDLDLTQFWLLAALALYAVAVGLGLFVYTATLRDRGAGDGGGGLDGVPNTVHARHHRGDRARDRRRPDRVPDGHQAVALSLGRWIASNRSRCTGCFGSSDRASGDRRKVMSGLWD
jgi:Predicted integral membrane protein (DUF2269)